MKKRWILLAVIACMLLTSISAFAYGGEFQFVFFDQNSKEPDYGERIMTKAADGDLYGYITVKSGNQGYETNLLLNNAYVYFRIRNADRSYATEYCTISKYVMDVTQRVKYLSSDAGYAARNYYLYGNVATTNSYPVIAAGTWCP